MSKPMTARFASLLGLGATSPRAEDDEEEKKDNEEAEGQDDEEQARAESDEEEKKDDEEAEGQDDEKKDDAKKAARAARVAERRRCGAIFAYGLKMGVPELAGTLAMDSDMTVAEAQAALATAKQFGGARRGAAALAEEMAATDVANPGSGAAAPTGQAAVVAQMKALYDRHTKRTNG